MLYVGLDLFPLNPCRETQSDIAGLMPSTLDGPSPTVHGIVVTAVNTRAPPARTPRPTGNPGTWRFSTHGLDCPKKGIPLLTFKSPRAVHRTFSGPEPSASRGPEKLCYGEGAGHRTPVKKKSSDTWIDTSFYVAQF